MEKFEKKKKQKQNKKFTRFSKRFCFLGATFEKLFETFLYEEQQTEPKFLHHVYFF